MADKEFLTKTEQKISEIETYIDNCNPILNRALVSPKELKMYFEELKSMIVADLKESIDIKQRKEEMIKEAELEAERIRQAARDELQRDPVVKQAKAYAKEIIHKAQKDAETTLIEAKKLRDELVINGHQYVDHMLTEIEKEFTHVLSEVEKEFTEKRSIIIQNREQLRNSLEKKVESIQTTTSA